MTTRPDTRPPVADKWAGAEMRVFPLFGSIITDQRMDGRTDWWMDRQTNWRTKLKTKNGILVEHLKEIKRNKLNGLLICIHYRRNSTRGRSVRAGLNCIWITFNSFAFFMTLYFGNLSMVNIIFHSHFLGKSEIDSNNYQLIFHENSKTGLRILIIHVYILDLSCGQIGVTCDPKFWPT